VSMRRCCVVEGIRNFGHGKVGSVRDFGLRFRLLICARLAGSPRPQFGHRIAMSLDRHKPLDAKE
jgi:hypothetical protein